MCFVMRMVEFKLNSAGDLFGLWRWPVELRLA